MPAAAAAQSLKSPEAFRTISEAASELDVPQHVLRFWETKFAQIKPVKRAGGRRYYRPDDVDLLRGIRCLLYTDGYTIRGVQKLLREQGVKYVAGVGRNGPPVRIPARQTKEAVPEYADGAAVSHMRAVSQPDPGRGALASHHLAEANRIKLELLLAELLQMKARLRAARERLKL